MRELYIDMGYDSAADVAALGIRWPLEGEPVLTEKDRRGRPLALYVHPDRRSEFRAQLSRLGRLERVTDWEVERVPREGSPVPVSLSAVAPAPA